MPASTVKHQPAHCGAGVDCPTILDGFEGGVDLGDLLDQVQQIPRRSRQPIQAGDNHNIATTKKSKKPLKLGTVPLLAADLLLKDTLAAVSGQLRHLCLQSLPVLTLA